MKPPFAWDGKDFNWPSISEWHLERFQYTERKSYFMSTIDGCQSGRKARAYKPPGSSVQKKMDRFLEVHKLLFGWSMSKDQAERIRDAWERALCRGWGWELTCTSHLTGCLFSFPSLSQYIESPDVEKEVKRLLSTDAEAVSVRILLREKKAQIGNESICMIWGLWRGEVSSAARGGVRSWEISTWETLKF